MYVLVCVVKQKTAYEIEYGLVGSEMCIRDRWQGYDDTTRQTNWVLFDNLYLSSCLNKQIDYLCTCLLYTSDAADERSSVDLGGRRIIKKKNIQDIESWRYVVIKRKSNSICIKVEAIECKKKSK